MGVAVDAAGNVYATDYYQNTLSVVRAGTNSPTLLASGLNRPIGVAVDLNGNIYFADSQSSAIKKLLPDSNAPILLTDYFYYPTGVAVDNAGNVYVADYGTNLFHYFNLQLESNILLIR